jgi:uncharacterized protein (DUF302 family)
VKKKVPIVTNREKNGKTNLSLVSLKENSMGYYYSRSVETGFTKTIDRVTEELKKEGFGVLTTIDVKKTFREKLDVEFQDYTILGACNPQFAYGAFNEENKVGTLLPCNVIVQSLPDGLTEIAVIDPLVSMQVVENSALERVAEEVRTRLFRAIDQV